VVQARPYFLKMQSPSQRQVVYGWPGVDV
jgi:hypothetical protein